jgi:lantibiotic transport system permease protein
MMWRLLQVELLKVRRSLALLMLVVCPLMVVLLNLGMLLKSGHVGKNLPLWQSYWLGNFALWCYFMLPLYIALITALLNGNEHKHQTWRLMLALPISQRQLFTAKAILAALFVLGANLALILFCLGGVVVLGLAGFPLDGWFDVQYLLNVGKITLACLPVIVVQHVVSWRFSHIVAPLALGVCATMGIIQLGSSVYWRYFPWSYSLMAANGGSPAMQILAMQLAVGVAASLFALALYWVGRTEQA